MTQKKGYPIGYPFFKERETGLELYIGQKNIERTRGCASDIFVEPKRNPSYFFISRNSLRYEVGSFILSKFREYHHIYAYSGKII